MRRTTLLALPLFLLFSSAIANAQPRPPERPDRPAPPAGDLPAPINVDDPMLQPIARPKTEIATWEDALKHVRARSTDLRIAAAEVARAEGLSRVALAGVLTTINATGTYTHNIITNTTSQVVSVNPLQFRPVETPFPDFVTANVALVQPVVAPRQWYAIGTAGRAEDAARLSLEDAKRLIALSVAKIASPSETIRAPSRSPRSFSKKIPETPPRTLAPRIAGACSNRCIPHG